MVQRARNPGQEETFPFMLDESLKNITIYITGTAVGFTLTNPSGTERPEGPGPDLDLTPPHAKTPLSNLCLFHLWSIFSPRTVKYFETCCKIPGLNQSQNEVMGKLGSAAQVGNLWRIRLHADKEPGPWKINIRSMAPYTLKVTGQTCNP